MSGSAPERGREEWRETKRRRQERRSQKGVDCGFQVEGDKSEERGCETGEGGKKEERKKGRKRLVLHGGKEKRGDARLC
jgi:hypothetical protein